MFFFEKYVLKSSLLDKDNICHAFSTRAGGVSTHPHTKTMNLSFNLGDDEETVRENMKLFCKMAGLKFETLCGSPQFHTPIVRPVTAENAGEGIVRENISPSDGFVTDRKGVSLIVRMADCTPLLLAGEKEDGSPVVGAVHAGWRGTVGGIGANAAYEMVKLGAVKSTIKVAVGQCIHSCCFEVQKDFFESVESLMGCDFANEFIPLKEGKLKADLVGMNVAILKDCGISEENIDICPYCTACDSEKFHSHRATGGKRGTMGAVIGIL